MDIGDFQGQGRLQNRKEYIRKRGLHFPHRIILTGVNNDVQQLCQIWPAVLVQ